MVRIQFFFPVLIITNKLLTGTFNCTEQDEIRKSIRPGNFLTWEDLVKMKYTWRVALEMLRMVPPVFGGFRTALEDIEYEGYVIPKGWQVR